MRKYIFLSALAVVLVSCSSVLITGRKQLNFVPDAEILSMSSQSYKQFIDSVPLSTNKTNTALVKKVGKNISVAVEEYLRNNGLSSEISNLSWEFNLVKDTSKNAFCMPGGKVVVFEGILPITKNEDGLAVVMGHEIAHAIAKHSNERLSQQMVPNLVHSLPTFYFPINPKLPEPVSIRSTALVFNTELCFPIRESRNMKPIDLG
jgi:predicted Zn-dependent protease